MDNLITFINQQLENGQFSTFFLLLFSFLGGILVSISPCNLSMLPLIVGYVVGADEKNTQKIALQLMMFFVGFSLIFAIIGVIAGLTGKVFASFVNVYWILLIASLILIFGLNMIGLLDFNFPVLVKKIPNQFQNHNYFYAFVLGAVFALAATPCATPVLAGIMAASTLTNNIALAVLMLFLFSLGQSVVVILAGLLTSFLKNIRTLNTQYATIIAGWIFIIFAILIYIKIFSRFFV